MLDSSIRRLFGMVEYKPFVRLVGAVVLYPKYPHRWCGSESGKGKSDGIDFSEDDGFFAATLAVNAIIGEKSKSGRGEEADAGAGGGPIAAPDVACAAQESIGENKVLENGASSSGGSNESNDRIRNHHRSVLDSGHCSNQPIPNRHRAALLDMLAGHPAYSSDETILASMLLATILENDAIDDLALEVFGVLPSPTINNEGDSPFETSITTYLSKGWFMIDSTSHSSSTSTVECVSTLGFMLLERLIFHTWTEAGQCIDVVPFEHFYKSSTFVQALGRSLSSFASQAQSHLHDASSIREIFSTCVRRRYSSSKDVNDCPPPTNNEDSEKLVCSLQSYYPSNFIDNASVLAGEIVYVGARIETVTGDLFLFNHDNEAAMCAVQATLHLRSLLTCIQEFYQRFTSNTSSRWYGRRESLSFCTTEEADDVMLSIGGIQVTPLPDFGTEIDLRGRKVFPCSLPRKARGVQEIVIDANGVKIGVTEKSDLVLVVDPLEIYVTKAKRDNPNRCTVLAVVPLRTIIASATEVSLPSLWFSFISKENIISNNFPPLKMRRREYSTLFATQKIVFWCHKEEYFKMGDFPSDSRSSKLVSRLKKAWTSTALHMKRKLSLI